MKPFFRLMVAFGALWLSSCGEIGSGKVDHPTVILGREITKQSGQSAVADTMSNFHTNDIFNIEVRVPDGFRVSELRLMIYQIEDAAGKQLGSEYLNRSQSLKGIDPKASQLVINNSAKNRTVARFIGAKPGKYRLEIHTEQYKLAEKIFTVYRKS